MFGVSGKALAKCLTRQPSMLTANRYRNGQNPSLITYTGQQFQQLMEMAKLSWRSDNLLLIIFITNTGIAVNITV